MNEDHEMECGQEPDYVAMKNPAWWIDYAADLLEWDVMTSDELPAEHADEITAAFELAHNAILALRQAHEPTDT